MYIIWLVLWNAISIFNPILWNQTNSTTGWSRELDINVGVWLVCVIQLKASAKRDGETISSNSWASTGPCISKVFHIRVASCVFGKKDRYWTVGHESHDHVLPHVFFKTCPSHLFPWSISRGLSRAADGSTCWILRNDFQTVWNVVAKQYAKPGIWS